ncbi:MAG: hypothetical protein J6S85_25605 [Methanobrevibacter sp.]|nr:hypothetical protein [Methanobrevibacter sp.]
MNTLDSYLVNLTAEQLRATDAINGYLLELAVKDYFHKPLVISKPGKLDLTATIDGKARRMEVKQNGGDFRYNCKGCSYIAYAVYIEPGKPLSEQFGYIMPMSVFKAVGYALNHIRTEKTDSAGHTKIALQTLYNYRKGDFHGAKAYKLADMWEQAGAITFKDFFKGQA